MEPSASPRDDFPPREGSASVADDSTESGADPVDLDRLARIVEARRNRGESAILTNGCFDLLHVGHLRSLQDARRRADYLIVCINDDESVRRHKGSNQPVYPQEERAELLLALSVVDYVHVFSGETVDPILRRIQPEFYAKGTDYTPETIPEAPTVRAYGGRIVIVGDPKDHSTRSTLARIRTTG